MAIGIPDTRGSFCFCCFCREVDAPLMRPERRVQKNPNPVLGAISALGAIRSIRRKSEASAFKLFLLGGQTMRTPVVARSMRDYLSIALAMVCNCMFDVPS